ncbi:NupC/NupG family nucleoside CNT transporter [Oceanirhabdus sp. W0125-5]|uniref:NupC/NupG family nucleoside CNT transporter n=1 Tax=Oceanirhabdus sp. W0125-5 TaxID=2999116 RepID=UPI0022F2F3CF|nr:NupC/NupG family nucleoside CNT transporter [Oceanirhabdus sp. W0125-5]WBW95150.1 NupC/NupG family nucleoside CNT transporter [Oceanirhabdus sp. W0125-5]
MDKIIGIIGLFVLIGIAVLCSENRKKINWKLVGIGIGLQIAFAFLILEFEPGRKFFEWCSSGITKLLEFTAEGSSFLFGGLMNVESVGFVWALQILPTIIFFSAFMSILYHLGIMQVVVNVLAKGMVKLLGTSGAETLSAVANIFVGQTEAPLVIKPFIATMTRSELLTVMTGGMATVAGGVMAGYAAMGVDPGHLLAASIMSAPASLVIAKIMLPETKEPVTKGKVEMNLESTSSNIIEAAANGASEGLTLALNVGAMVLAFIALVALINAIIGGVGSLMGMEYLNLSWILGRLFAPLAYIMGIPAADVIAAGDLLGQKIVMNEFVAYANLAPMIAEQVLQPKTIVILTYALCGFANFSSIAIQIAGIGGLAPSRKSEIAQLGLKSMIGGSLAAFMTAAIAGILF